MKMSDSNALSEKGFRFRMQPKCPRCDAVCEPLMLSASTLDIDLNWRCNTCGSRPEDHIVAEVIELTAKRVRRWAWKARPSP